jgi:hypothetical protein
MGHRNLRRRVYQAGTNGAAGHVCGGADASSAPLASASVGALLPLRVDERGAGPRHTISADNYCPVPLTFSNCTAGFAESVTVTVLTRAAIALGVNVTVNVQLA